jgi:hypothetical protein
MSGPRLNIDGYIFSDFVDLQRNVVIERNEKVETVKERNGCGKFVLP